MKKTYTFYIIKCSKDDRVYIGCTSKTLKKRWSDHLSYIRTNPTTPFHKEASKIGIDYFTIHEIEKGLYDRKSAVIREEELISEHDSRNNGFNGSWSRPKEKNGWYGKGASNDNFTDPNKNPSVGVIQKTSKAVSINGVEYPSISHAARDLGMDRSKVAYRVKSQKGFDDWFLIDNINP